MIITANYLLLISDSFAHITDTFQISCSLSLYNAPSYSYITTAVADILVRSNYLW